MKLICSRKFLFNGMKNKVLLENNADKTPKSLLLITKAVNNDRAQANTTGTFTTTDGDLRMKLTTGKALLAGCIAMAMSQAAMAKDIKVAIVGAMSGPVAQYGDMEFTGARQAIADINAKGGIKGDKLVGVEYDDACDPKQAVAVANKVINDGIRYVIGHLCSSSTQPASDIYEDEGVIMITPAATNADLTTRGYKMILRTTGLDSDQGPTAAKYILSDIKPKRIAVVHDKQQYGEGLARSVRDSLKNRAPKWRCSKASPPATKTSPPWWRA